MAFKFFTDDYPLYSTALALTHTAWPHSLSRTRLGRNHHSDIELLKDQQMRGAITA
jgi:hypothetical protein